MHCTILVESGEFSSHDRHRLQFVSHLEYIPAIIIALLCLLGLEKRINGLLWTCTKPL